MKEDKIMQTPFQETVSKEPSRRCLYQDLYTSLQYRVALQHRKALGYQWEAMARENQKVPPGSWRVWMILAGRGFGKTRTGAETIRQWVTTGKAKRIALVSDTESEGRDVMIEGISGLIAIHPPQDRPLYEPSKRRLTWRNGAIATLFSAENYEQLRGPQFDTAWVDELAKFRCAQDVWDQLALTLRLGKHPRIVVTTTPRPIPLIKQLLEGEKTGQVAITRGTTFENRQNLASSFLDHLQSAYVGTRLGAQELEGKVLEDIEGVLWTSALLEQASLPASKLPDSFARLVVAVDPAVTSQATSDETGIIVAGLDSTGTVYILQDLSGRYSPTQWAQRALQAYHTFKADCIVAENNQGGDLVESIIRSLDPTVAFQAVHATRGKALRAEPVLALYEQGRVKHIRGAYALLEEQMATYVPGKSSKSPDRLDALVWAVTELLLPKDTSIKPYIWGVGNGLRY